MDRNCVKAAIDVSTILRTRVALITAYLAGSNSAFSST
jgi:hypothetical protein